VVCDDCLRRTWLLEAMGSHLDFRRGSMLDVLDLDDDSLIALTGGEMRRALSRDHARFGRDDARRLRSRAQGASLTQLCRCDDLYPAALAGLRASPAVLHIAGGLERFLKLCAADPVALVGARKANEYGRDMAQALGRGISASGLTVVSGMALGVDGAAHEGALLSGGLTIAVLPGCAAVAYPASKRELHRRIIEAGVAVSETGPGAAIRRWMFPARNRIIAAMSRLTVLVQARQGSGALLTVDAARHYGREVGAVPGSVKLELSQEPNALIADGAWLIRDAQDVLDVIFGVGRRVALNRVTPALDPGQQAVIDAIRAGADTIAGLARMGCGGERGLETLAALELSGVLRRTTGGRYEVTG
jgi:DNA processing protein